MNGLVKAQSESAKQLKPRNKKRQMCERFGALVVTGRTVLSGSTCKNGEGSAYKRTVSSSLGDKPFSHHRERKF